MNLIWYGHSHVIRYHPSLCCHSRICRGGSDHLRCGYRAIIRVLFLEFSRPAFTYDQTRREFTDKIVFGLEFLIAGDILSTLLSPTQQDLINLAVVVVIRTVLGYFLSKETPESVQG